MPDDIVTSRLVLRLMSKAVVTSCIAGDFAEAERLLGATIPDDLLESSSSLRFNLRQMEKDPLYLPWSARAVILPEEQKMIGLIRFHSSPDPEELHA
ncbi:hypothetical protein [Chitinophaga solisilvae]|uniref:hypothetical protein n=1 Tax=Chitinophaga solisilvae TaxID=1233460 RepID=UPI00136E1744|nr:hypothetical protein [Chitinophaga solisilvae]